MPVPIIVRREPQNLKLNSVRPIAEDVYRDPVSIAPHSAPDPIPSPRPTRIARTWIRAFVGGLPPHEEDRLLGRPYQPKFTKLPRGAMIPEPDPANIYLPPSTAYGSQVEV